MRKQEGHLVSHNTARNSFEELSMLKQSIVRILYGVWQPEKDYN